MPSKRSPASRAPRAAPLLGRIARIEPHERRAVALAFLCNFMLLGSYYILRPVRDTVATVFGVEHLQLLFTGTFIGTLLASPIYTALATRLPLRRLLPGVFWFWLANVLLFQALFRLAPASLPLAAAYYIWFSVVNLFMISVFWSLMADLFLPEQAARLFALIAAGGTLGAIAGPLVTRLVAPLLSLSGLLLIAAAGFAGVIALVHLLMREKERLRASGAAQRSTLAHQLPGSFFDGVQELFKSAYSRNQALFMLLMTYVNTIAYFFQTEVIGEAFAGVEERVLAIADIALVVNVCSAAILIFGVARIVRRFGVTTTLVLNPLIMVVAFCAMALSPSVFMIQALQVTRSVAQYAIARPAREICFTVLEQNGRYKAKNVIDTVIYRFGDVSAAWIQAGLRSAGLRIIGSSAVGVGVSLLWGLIALRLGQRYEALRAQAAGYLEPAGPAPPVT